MQYRVRVWDAPTRWFHWLLAAGVIALVVTAQMGGSAMEWHFRLGYAILSLLFFRGIWGLVGGHWSRFRTFLFHPSQIIRYLVGRDEQRQWVGHNPLGALSTFTLLGLLMLQAVSGLFSDDEIAASGPLTAFVSSDWVSNATYYHKDIGQYLLMVLVALHVAAILAYFLKKRENLLKPMITGDKTLPFPAPASSDRARDRIKAAFIFGCCAALVVGALNWIG